MRAHIEQVIRANFRPQGPNRDADTAAALGLTAESVSRRRRQLGLRYRPNTKSTPKQRDQAAKLLLQGLSDQEVARRTGMKVRNVGTLARKLDPTRRRLPAVPLPQSVITQLGTVPDADLANIAGVSPERIGAERRRRGIPVLRRRGWQPTARELKIMATHPDHEAARLLGRTASAIATARRHHLGPRFRRVNWTPEIEQALRDLSPQEAAERYGISLTAIKARRIKLGLTSKHTPPRWTKRMIAKLGTAPDPTVAADLGLTHGQVRHARERRGIAPFRVRGPTRHWKPKHDPLLGTMSDGEVAKKTGCSAHTVARRREQLGIESFVPSHRHALATLRSPRWEKELGRLHDHAIARKVGCTLGAAADWRRSLGIAEPPSHLPRADYIPPPIKALLPQVPDTDLVHGFRISAPALAAYRRTAGVANPATMTPGQPPAAAQASKHQRDLLAWAVDDFLVQYWQISKSRIARLRDQLSIPNRYRNVLPEDVLHYLAAHGASATAMHYGIPISKLKSAQIKARYYGGGKHRAAGDNSNDR